MVQLSEEFKFLLENIQSITKTNGKQKGAQITAVQPKFTVTLKEELEEMKGELLMRNFQDFGREGPGSGPAIRNNYKGTITAQG